MSTFADKLSTMSPERRLFALRSLPQHLSESGQTERLKQILSAFDFLHAKVNVLGPQALIEDYESIQTDQTLSLVQSAIRAAAHILDKDVDSLAPQLTGRLLPFEQPEIQSLLGEIVTSTESPWLRPMTPCFDTAGGPLLRTIDTDADCLAVTPDGKRLITAGYAGALKVWNLDTGQEIMQLNRNAAGGVEGLIVTPDGGRLLSASKGSGAFVLWDLETGQELHRLAVSGDYKSVAFVTSDGQRAVVSAGYRGPIKVWDLQSGNELLSIPSGYPFTVTADDRYVISRADGLEVKMWDLNSGECVRTMSGYKNHINTIIVTPDGRRVFSTTPSHKSMKLKAAVQEWDLSKGRKYRRFAVLANDIETLAGTPDGKRMVSTAGWSWENRDYTVKVWDVSKRKKPQHILAGHSNFIKDAAVTPDGKRLFSASSDHMIKEWDLENGSEIRTLRGHSSSVEKLVLTPDSRRLISASLDGTVKVWDLDSQQTDQMRDVHSGKIHDLAVTPDGRYLLSGSDDDTLKIWDIRTGQVVSTYTYRSGVNAVTVFPDGRRAAASVLHVSESLFTFDIHTSLTMREYAWTRGIINAIAVTPDERHFIVADQGQHVSAWDVNTGEMLYSNYHSYHGGGSSNPGVSSVVVTPDGSRFISASKQLKVWDVASGQELQTLDGCSHIALTPDGNRLLSASSDHALKLWDLQNGQELKKFGSHSNEVTDLAITPDGKYGVSASEDHTLKIWDLSNGEKVADFRAEVRMSACAAAPDGTIIAGDDGGRVYFLRLENAVKGDW